MNIVDTVDLANVGYVQTIVLDRGTTQWPFLHEGQTSIVVCISARQNMPLSMYPVTCSFYETMPDKDNRVMDWDIGWLTDRSIGRQREGQMDRPTDR